MPFNLITGWNWKMASLIRPKKQNKIKKVPNKTQKLHNLVILMTFLRLKMTIFKWIIPINSTKTKEKWIFSNSLTKCQINILELTFRDQTKVFFKIKIKIVLMNFLLSQIKIWSHCNSHKRTSKSSKSMMNNSVKKLFFYNKF